MIKYLFFSCLLAVNMSADFNSFISKLKKLPEGERLVFARQYLDGRTTPIIEQDSLVHFVWLGQAENVGLTGDYQDGWSVTDAMAEIGCGEESLFYRSIILPETSRLDYLFVVDDVSMLDPRNPRQTPSGFGTHSEIILSGFAPTPWVSAESRSKGRLETLEFVSADTSIHPRNVKLYLPYDHQTFKGLPLLVVHDGFDALEYGRFKTILDAMIEQKKIPPVAALFIPPVEREPEYVWHKQPAYMNALYRELIPALTRQYGLTIKAENRAVMGISNGGCLALCSLLDYPDVFRAGAGQSSAVTPGLSERADRLKEETCPESLKLYLDVGRFDLVHRIEGWSLLESNRKLHDKLKDLGVPHRYFEYNDGHQWAGWRERTPQILMWFFGHDHQ